MTREEQLESCSICKTRTFNPKMGIVCGITNEIATFDGICPDFKEDETAKNIEEKVIQNKKSDSNRTINKGRIALFIVGGLYIFIGFYEAFFMDFHALIYGIVDWIIGGLFIGLAIWSYRKAFIALIIGLGLYILLIALLAYFDPSTIISGIIWKVLIIFFLVTSIKAAKDEQSKIKLQRGDLLDEF